MTRRMKDVLDQLAYDGADNATIARRLGISVDTVKTHLRKASERLGCSNRTAIAVALVRGDVVVLARDEKCDVCKAHRIGEHQKWCPKAGGSV